MSRDAPVKLSFKDFLEKYKSKETFAIGRTQGTIGYSILTSGEDGKTHEYIHTDVREVHPDEFIEFLMELHKAFDEKRPS